MRGIDLNRLHLVALAIFYGAVLVSRDNDFARFRGLRWENPLH
jgi:predicted nucleic acid-binding protein